MKSLMSRIFIAGVAITGLFVAEAQTRVATADVPISFYMGETAMPAGAYEVDRLALGQVLALRTRNAADSIVASRITGKADELPRLVFNRYGETYVLREVWIGNGDTGYQLARSKRENELASNGAAPVVAVIRLAIH
jgi:hypothetical protein